MPHPKSTDTSSAPPSGQDDLRGKFIAGTAWMGGLRWGLKLLGIVSTLIVARILTPQDYGLVAMAIMVSSFMQVWLDFGVRQSLIQNQQADREDYDTAWSVRIIQGTSIALILAAGSPFIADFFNEPQLTSLLWLVAASIVLTALSNIGVVNFQKEMNFRREVVLEISSKVISITITIAIAFWLRNYWALAIGIFSHHLAFFILSYVLHPYRPRWSLSRFRSLWSFSQWMLLSNIGMQLGSKADRFVVGKLAAASGLGIYTIALELAEMATKELANPISRTLLPLIAKVKENKKKVLDIYLKVIGGVNTLTIPAGIGLALIAKPFILVFLGEKWIDAVPYLQIFAIYSIFNLLLVGANGIFIATGRVRLLSGLLWFEGFLLLAFSLIGFFWLGMIGVAYGRLASGLIYAAVIYAYLARHIDLTIPALWGQIWRPALSAAIMLLAMLTTPMGTLSPLLTLVLSLALGGTAYAATSYILWRLCGRPDGMENVIVSIVTRFIRGRKASASTAK